mmetsp:Transcript_12507/g.26083  ORF Transcript_12507/g.26083 Transcript_12507/m.26083 type:complete len:258 (+) Transcript_12507:333-1106(+)
MCFLSLRQQIYHRRLVCGSLLYGIRCIETPNRCYARDVVVTITGASIGFLVTNNRRRRCLDCSHGIAVPFLECSHRFVLFSFLLSLLLVLVHGWDVPVRIEYLEDRHQVVVAVSVHRRGCRHARVVAARQRRKELSVDQQVEASKVFVHFGSAGCQHVHLEAPVAGIPVVIEDATSHVSTEPDLRSVHGDLLLAGAFAPGQGYLVLFSAAVAREVPGYSNLAVFYHLSDLLFRVVHLVHGIGSGLELHSVSVIYFLL